MRLRRRRLHPALLEEKEKSRDEGINSLRQETIRIFAEFPPNSTLEQAAEGLNAWKTTLREEGERCKENLRQLRELQEKLQGIEADKIRLKAGEEQAEKEAVEKKPLLRPQKRNGKAWEGPGTMRQRKRQILP